MIWEYKIEVLVDLGWRIKKGSIITFIEGDPYSFSVVGKDGQPYEHNLDYHQKKDWVTKKSANDKRYFKILEKNVGIENRCQPYMYNTNDDLNKFKVGDIVEIKFQNKHKVRKEFSGKTLKFQIVNSMSHKWLRPTQRLALVLADKINKFSEKDVLYLDDYNRFECLMIDLFPCNRRPYAGWKNKEVTIKKVK